MIMARTPSLNASSRVVFILLRADALRTIGGDSLREAECPPKLQRRRASVLRVSYRESLYARRALRGNDHRSQTASARTQSRKIFSYRKVQPVETNHLRRVHCSSQGATFSSVISNPVRVMPSLESTYGSWLLKVLRVLGCSRLQANGALFQDHY